MALLVLLINIKFTGIVFGGILGLTALAYGIRRGASRKTLLLLAGLGSSAAILGVALFGFFPYATNAYRHGNPVHPFYPAIVFGGEVSKKHKQKTVFMEDTSHVLSGRSQYEKWWISLFSQKTESFWKPAPLPPFSSLIPLSFLQGFGSLFSGSMLLCLPLMLFVRHKGAWIVLAGVMISVLGFGTGFSFRHAPQNWWLPLLFLVFLLAPDDGKNLLARLPRFQAPRIQAPRFQAQTARILVFLVTACLLYTSVLRLAAFGERSVSLSWAVRQAERQGGWFVTPDTSMEDWATPVFFHYYESGLSSVRLPTLSECPEKAEKRKLILGLVLCRP